MKDFFLTDEEIRVLIDEPKKMNRSTDSLLRDMKIKKGRASSVFQYAFRFPRQNNEGSWQIYLRRNRENALDFSCGMEFVPKGRNQAFTLRRYNGKSHEHTNRLEGHPPFYDFHIHEATEKYQRSSYKDEHYATPTDRYADLSGAVRCLLADFQVTGDSSGDSLQMELLS